MKLLFSTLLILPFIITGCCKPINPLPEVAEAKVRYLIPDDDSGLVMLPLTDFTRWVEVTGKLRINDNICREASK